MSDVPEPFRYSPTNHVQGTGCTNGKYFTVGGIILAAGASSRMGTPKQLLPFRDRTMIRHVAEVALASGLDPIVVVLGANASDCTHALAGLPVRYVNNDSWQNGIGSSIRCGMRELCLSVELVVILLCDQPLIASDLIRRLITVQRTTNSAIVACEYAESRGVPALFSRAYFDDLMAIPDAEGAKRIIACAGTAAVGIPISRIAVDIDTPTDYAQLCNMGRA